jgi:UPF0716 protein FxsA
MPLSHKRDAMPLLLLLLFPLAEIATFIIVGGKIGLVRTLALVIVSAIVGIIMLRDAGAMTALKLQRQKGNPATILAEGGTRMLAGVLLLIPGFLTDIAAILILIPAVRRAIIARLGKNAPASPTTRTETPSQIIDGDFRRLDGEK